MASNTYITLNEQQGDATLFPVSCQVTDLEMNITGAVKAVQIDINSDQQHNLYLLDHPEHMEPISEMRLSFAPSCKVWFEGTNAATILAAYRPPNSQFVVNSLLLDDGRLYHGIMNDQITFRKEHHIDAIQTIERKSSTIQSIAPSSVERQSSTIQSIAPSSVERQSSTIQSIAPSSVERQSSTIQSIAPSSVERQSSTIQSMDASTCEGLPHVTVEDSLHVSPPLVERDDSLNCIIFLQFPSWLSEQHLNTHLDRHAIKNCPYLHVFSANQTNDSLCPQTCRSQLHICLASTSMEFTSLASKVVQEQMENSVDDQGKLKLKRGTIEWDVCIQSKATAEPEKTKHSPVTPLEKSYSRTITISHWYGNLELLQNHMHRTKSFLELQTNCSIVTTLAQYDKLQVNIIGKDKNSLERAGKFVENSILSQVKSIFHRRLLYDMAQKPGQDSPVFQRKAANSEKRVWMTVVPVPTSSPSSAKKAMKAIIAYNCTSQIFIATACRVKLKLFEKGSIPPFVFVEGPSQAQVEKAELSVVEQMIPYMECASSPVDTLAQTTQEEKESPDKVMTTMKRAHLCSRVYEIPSWFGDLRKAYLNLFEAKASVEARVGGTVDIYRVTTSSGSPISVEWTWLVDSQKSITEKVRFSVIDQLLSVVSTDARGSHSNLLVGRLRYLWCMNTVGEAVEQSRGRKAPEYCWFLVVDLGDIDSSEVGALFGIDGKKKKTLETTFNCFVFLVPHASSFVYIEGSIKEQVEGAARVIQRSKESFQARRDHDAISLL